MPKPVKKAAKKARPDVNEIAFDLVRRSTEESQPEAPASTLEFKGQLSAYMSKLGQKGGRESGKRRMDNLSEQQRRDIASHAARKRWEAVAKQRAAKKR
jgi:hypothetical protein